jgi:hypothetical protein
VAIPLRRLVLFLSLLAMQPLSLHSQVPGAWSGCKGDSLSTWNCAHYYTGTVSLTAELKGANLNLTRSVIATVAAGRVTCRIKESETPEYEGPGMLAVEHETTANAGEYAINVWCPEAAGERPGRDDSPLIQVMEQRAADYALLTGTDAHEHPDADSANGLSGTETITWRLQRR